MRRSYPEKVQCRYCICKTDRYLGNIHQISECEEFELQLELLLYSVSDTGDTLNHSRNLAVSWCLMMIWSVMINHNSITPHHIHSGCPQYLFPRSCLRPDLVRDDRRPPQGQLGAAGGESSVSCWEGRQGQADMSSDIAREESFRTALRNQKRRLSATEKKPVSAEFGPGREDGGGWCDWECCHDNTTQVSTSLCWEVSRRGTASPHPDEIFSLHLELRSPHPGQLRPLKTRCSANRGACQTDNNTPLHWTDISIFRKTLHRMENNDENSCPNSKQSTPDIRLEYWDINELSPLSTPAVSRSPSPFDFQDFR